MNRDELRDSNNMDQILGCTDRACKDGGPEMTKEQIESAALKSICYMVDEPFEYCVDNSEKNRAMASLTIGAIYGILTLAERLKKGADAE